MSQKKIRIIGWIISVVLGLLFAFSAFMKLSPDEAALAQAALVGFDESTYRLIGVIELLSLILFLIPRTGLLGSLLLIAYLGGAIATHLQHQDPATMAVAAQVLLWIAMALRYPVLLHQLFPATQRLIKHD